ncbi:MAG: RDD family protein [SAR324 cluster bacterium]|nr:RDD family protein [SAR324 cluster bacterium]
MAPAHEPLAPTTLAPHHQRLFALIIDYLVIITFLKLTELISLGAEWDLRPVSPTWFGVAPLWGVGLVGLLLAKDTLAGMSMGKWFTGIAVRRAEEPGSVPALARLLLRNVLLLLLPVEGVLVFTDGHGRRLGDRWAGTVVVALPRPAPPLRRLTVLAILFLGVLLASFLLTPWNMRRSAAYQEGYRLAAGDPALAAAVGVPAVVGTSPDFALNLTPEGGTARLVFDIEGPLGEGETEVVLNLDRSASRWERVSVRVLGEPPPSGPSDAPPRPLGDR